MLEALILAMVSGIPTYILAKKRVFAKTGQFSSLIIAIVIIGITALVSYTI